MGDFLNGFTLKDIATAYVDVTKAKLGAGLAYQNDYIDQLKGTVSLLSQQNQAQLYAQQQAQLSNNFDVSGLAKWAVLGVVVFVVIKAVK